MMEISETDVKKMMIETLSLDDLTPDEIDSNAELFGEGLGLDSIDALELGVTLKKRYNVSVDSDNTDTKMHFQTVASLTQFINANLGGK